MTLSIQESLIALTTYHAYSEAWVACVKRIHGGVLKASDSIREQIQEKPAFKRLNQDGSAVQIASHYRRGMLTLAAMRHLPVSQYPQLASFANFWLPVECYYAIHGLGLAALMALGHDAPRTHSAFCAAFADGIVKRFFPTPIDALCSGGPSRDDFMFSGINVSALEVTRYNAFASNLEREEIRIGKSLSTTRQRILKSKFDDARKAGKKKRLFNPEKKSISQKLYPTSICDFLYRMRLRSNYDDPDMYIVALDDSDVALKHYTDLLFLTEVIAVAVNFITERKIGRDQMAMLNKPLP